MKIVFVLKVLVYIMILIITVTNLCMMNINYNDLSAIRRQRIKYYMFQTANLSDDDDDSHLKNKADKMSSFLLQEHFLTLFTTFNSSKEKFYLYNNTLHGWMLMKPKVVLVLFSNDSELQEYAKNIGWDLTLNVGLTACNSTPVLKDMFLTTQKLINSKFYAYANADILFNRGLINTLEGLAKNDHLYQKSILLAGKRSDLLLDDFNITHIRGEDQINSAFRKSKIYYGYAEDYFIVNNKFPWHIYPNLVVGRPVVDNYLAYISRINNVNVIDTSATIGALHQMTKSRKKTLSNCNKHILGKRMAWWKIAKGNVECFPMETRFDFNGSVFIMTRGLFTMKC